MAMGQVNRTQSTDSNLKRRGKPSTKNQIHCPMNLEFISCNLCPTEHLTSQTLDSLDLHPRTHCQFFAHLVVPTHGPPSNNPRSAFENHPHLTRLYFQESRSCGKANAIHLPVGDGLYHPERSPISPRCLAPYCPRPHPHQQRPGLPPPSSQVRHNLKSPSLGENHASDPWFIIHMSLI